MSTIEVIALKPFLYSTDGFTEISVSEKQVFNLPERFFESLNGAKFVRRAKIGDGKIELTVKGSDFADTMKKVVDTALKSAGVMNSSDIKKLEETEKNSAEEAETTNASDVEIPDDWRTLKFFALRSLAAKISAEPVTNMEEAVAAIEAELAKRDKE